MREGRGGEGWGGEEGVGRGGRGEGGWREGGIVLHLAHHSIGPCQSTGLLLLVNLY